MEMTGAKILMECLLEQGVDLVFGYPGGTILNVYDELYHYRDRITHILTAHEQGASHAADGYAVPQERWGCAWPPRARAATNLTTGIATAYMDSSPVVFITCNVTQNLIGQGMPSRRWTLPACHAHHQMHLSGPGCQQPGRHRAGGLCHRPQRPARPCAH